MGDNSKKRINKPDTSFLAFATVVKFLLEREEDSA
jgi:hypothetical protein